MGKVEFLPSLATTAVMRANKGKDSKPELSLRRALHRRGVRYTLHVPIRTSSQLVVRPDLVFSRSRIAVFVDGCYWHACFEHGTRPARNAGYWLPKLTRNIERDRAVDAALGADGWTVVRVWEHEPAGEAAAKVAKLVADKRPISER